MPNEIGHLVASRDPVQREGQGQLQDPERPLLFCVTAGAVLKVERKDRTGSMSWRITRRCRREGLRLELKRPAHAAVMRLIPAVSAMPALGSALHGGLAHFPKCRTSGTAPDSHSPKGEEKTDWYQHQKAPSPKDAQAQQEAGSVKEINPLRVQPKKSPVATAITTVRSRVAGNSNSHDTPGVNAGVSTVRAGRTRVLDRLTPPAPIRSLPGLVPHALSPGVPAEPSSADDPSLTARTG